jgi:hypothetical protein
MNNTKTIRLWDDTTETSFEVEGIFLDWDLGEIDILQTNCKNGDPNPVYNHKKFLIPGKKLLRIWKSQGDAWYFETMLSTYTK